MAKVGRLVKDLMVQELTVALTERPNFFVASLGGLQAGEADTLRKRLRPLQAKLMMVKRTLSLRGLSSLKLNGAGVLFEGSVAFVFPGQALIPAAKLLVDFAKANQGKLTIRGGWVDGQLLDKSRVEELASLPPKPQLIAQLVGVIESPLVELVLIIEQALGELAWVLEEAAEKRTQAGKS